MENPPAADGAASVESEIKKNEFYLNYTKFIWDKIKLQRETTDRYFNYYLLLVTTPIVAFAAVVGRESKAIDAQLIGLLCLFLFSLGVVFFCLYIRQRINNLRLGEELNDLTRLMANSSLLKSLRLKHDGLIVNGIISSSTPLSADFWVSMIQTVINTFWIINAAYFIDIDLRLPFFWLYKMGPALWGITCIILHVLGRDLRLFRFEKRNPLRPTVYLFGAFYWRWRRVYLYKIKRVKRPRIH